MTETTLVVLRDIHGGYNLARVPIPKDDVVLPNPRVAFTNGDPDKKDCTKLAYIWDERNAHAIARELNIPILRVVNPLTDAELRNLDTDTAVVVENVHSRLRRIIPVPSGVDPQPIVDRHAIPGTTTATLYRKTA